jgi:hypothetical protein
MDTQTVHQTGCTRSVHPGVGVEPGEFTSPGGGSRPGRDRLAKWLEEIFDEVIFFRLGKTDLQQG